MVQTSLENKFPLKFIRLNATESVKSFDCGNADLNDFIVNRATEFQKYMLAVNYACVNAETGKVYAYCSLANDKIALDNFKDKSTASEKKEDFQT